MKHFENKRYLDLTDRYDIEIGLSMRHSFKKMSSMSNLLSHSLLMRAWNDSIQALSQGFALDE